MTPKIQLIIFLLVVSVVVVILRRNPKLLGTLRGGTGEIGIKDPLLISTGLIVFNLVSWAMIPWWWDTLNHTWYHFIFFNVGLWTVLYLRTIKVKDKDGKDTKENHPTASKIASIITLVLVAGLVTTAGSKILTWWEKPKDNTSSRTATDFSQTVPVDVFLPLAGECESPGESGGKQFNADKSVVRGEKDKDDTGALQINKRIHADLIKKHPEIDIAKSKEDNYKFGKILYRKYGTRPWFKTQSCWESKLAALGYGNGPIKLPLQLAVLDVPTDKWSNEVKSLLINGTNLVWGRTDKSKGGKCEVMLDKDPKKIFPITEMHTEFDPQKVQFKCAEPVQMKVYVVRKN